MVSSTDPGYLGPKFNWGEEVIASINAERVRSVDAQEIGVDSPRLISGSGLLSLWLQKETTEQMPSFTVNVTITCKVLRAGGRAGQRHGFSLSF